MSVLSSSHSSALFFSLVLLTDCQNSEIVIQNNEPFQVRRSLSFIDRSSDTLTQNDAVIVATIFSSSQQLTRSHNQFVISVVPVKDEAGETLLYGINYEDGYVLVSATKLWYPIISVIEHGCFTGEPTGTGVDVLIEEDTSLSVNRSVWAPYENKVDIGLVSTRSGFDNIVNDSLYNWSALGWSVYTLAHQPDNMPDDLYEEFCEAAYDENGLDPLYDYWYYTFILEKNEQSDVWRGPLLQTTWGQDYPYTSIQNQSLGCETIATGQIMRYYEYPEYSAISFPYDWSEMPDHLADTSSPNYDLSLFLNYLRNELGVANGATIDNAKSTLEGYGYACNKILHNANQVYSSLNAYRPVYMKGTDSSLSLAHAWVCDGYHTIDTHDRYRLMVFKYSGGSSPSYYDEERNETINNSVATYFHMNWGWSGDNNGYYLDQNITTSIYLNNNLTSYNPSYNRKDLLITYPSL